MKNDLMWYLQRHGSHSSAYSSLQEGLEHFVLPGAGYIPYARTSGMVFALSDPICSEEDYPGLVGAFLERFPRSAFIHVTPVAAARLSDLGFYVNEMGVETELLLGSFDYRGRAKESMRRMIRRALEAGVQVREYDGAPDLGAELREVTSEWLSTRRVKDREFWFLVRRAVYHGEPDVRRFIATENGRVTGFIFFDPMYREGRVYGYLACALRARPSAHGGTLALIMNRAIETFREEGVEVLSLGLSPFSEVEDVRYRHSPLMKHIFRFLYERGGGIYHFKGLSFFKSRYAGERTGRPGTGRGVIRRKIYFAHRSRFPLRELYLSSRLVGFFDTPFGALRRFLSGAFS